MNKPIYNHEGDDKLVSLKEKERIRLKNLPITLDVGLIANPEIIRVMALKKKHYESLEEFSFSEDQIEGRADYPAFDILGRLKFQVVIRFRENQHLKLIHDMDLARFLSARDTNCRENTYLDARADMLKMINDLPQIIID